MSKIIIVAILVMTHPSLAGEVCKAESKYDIPWFGLQESQWESKSRSSDESDIKVDTAKKDLSDARWGFLIGATGMTVQFIANAMSLPVIRTVGNFLWGNGWSAWLGGYGSAKDELCLTKKDSSEKVFIDNSNQKTKVIPSHFRRASVQGAIGESSNLFVVPEGVYVHPIYNDVNGGTDKLLTASAKLGVLRTYDSFSIESVVFWRLLTPTFKTEFETDDLPKPVGRYADWAEWKTSIAKVSEFLDLPIRTQFTVGLSDIGNKGGREVHREFHRLTRNTLEHLEYTNQPTGRFLTVGTEIGIIGYQQSASMNQLASLTAESSKMMRELGLRMNGVLVLKPGYWEYALEARVIRQLSSEVFAGIEPWRYEGAAGVRIFKHFAPSVKYVSSYLEGDSVGQTYFDLLHYNFVF